MKNPKTKMWVMLVVGFVIIGAALFLAAGTIHYWQAWTYLAVGFVTSALLTLYIVSDPILLESRVKGGPTAEQRPLQKVIVLCLGLLCVAAYIMPVLDHRFGWSSVPSWLSIIGNMLIIVSMWAVYRVFKENSFGSTTVEISKEQKVISTGPYAIVRNPMYSCAILYFPGVTLALGSYWGLIPCVLIVLGFVWRLLDEEKFLSQNLSGYQEYKTKVRWHLVPGIF
ncbi:MAG TPA: isoprenylcysteine carboxylmethyltransferase family protein [Candidatus Paceibacterota bacterium]|nr:isoprenylcysteine carboxylmethyltransferase family protein [Candidatus Paceibacterota bacterium]